MAFSVGFVSFWGHSREISSISGSEEAELVVCYLSVCCLSNWFCYFPLFQETPNSVFLVMEVNICVCVDFLQVLMCSKITFVLWIRYFWVYPVRIGDIIYAQLPVIHQWLMYNYIRSFFCVWFSSALSACCLGLLTSSVFKLPRSFRKPWLHLMLQKTRFHVF